MEKEGGDVERGFFNASHPWTGPKPPDRMPAEWIATLDSADPMVVLETLTWLGGHHMGSTERREPNVNQESVEDSLRFEMVRDDPRTRLKLAELSRSGNPWVSAAAALAARRD